MNTLYPTDALFVATAHRDALRQRQAAGSGNLSPTWSSGFDTGTVVVGE